MKNVLIPLAESVLILLGLTCVLLNTLGATLLRNSLAGKGVIRDGDGMIRAGQKF